MRQNSRITGRRICAAVVLAMVTAWGIPALAPAASANAAVAFAATRSTPPRTPQVPPRPAASANAAVAFAATYSTPRPSPRGSERRNVAECVAWITNSGYTYLPSFTIACTLPTLNYGNPIAYALLLSGCVGLLKLSGVDDTTSGLACGAAGSPLLTEEQWCYGNWCLNAWGGGPYVNEYTGGPETGDNYQDFWLVNENGNGYGSGNVQLRRQGLGSPWSDDCIGDYNNNSGLADAGLVGCGTASGGQGWGTNMTVGTSGCPTGEAWFHDNHWNGYLGPGGSANGTHWYLNKPNAYCFNVTFFGG